MSSNALPIDAIGGVVFFFLLSSLAYAIRAIQMELEGLHMHNDSLSSFKKIYNTN